MATEESGGRTPHIVCVIAGLGAGGAERVLSLLTTDWVRRGRRVTVIAFDAPKDPVFHPFDPAVTIVRPVRRRGRLGQLVWLRRTLADLRPDLLLSLLTKINVLALAASVGRRWPVIVSERNNPQAQGAHPLWNALLARLYPRAAAIVMQTEASLRCLSPAMRWRAHVIPNPIALPAQAAARTGPPVLTAVGRLTEQKGFDLLIDAYARIADRHPDWRLCIWGEGPLRSALAERVAERGMDGRIWLAGVSAGPIAWVADAHGFVLSSRYEGFANVLGEAMAAGLPVVAYDCDFGPSVLIRDGVDGLLVAPGDVEALAAALDRLMADGALRDRLAMAARRRTAAFAPDRIVARWQAVIAPLLGDQ
jgi:glycosyltransferase involved in cell wall biosynthesis